MELVGFVEDTVGHEHLDQSIGGRTVLALEIVEGPSKSLLFLGCVPPF
jgi:hypothetical protein